MTRGSFHRRWPALAAGVLAAVALAGGSFTVVGIVLGSACAVPELPGSVVHVSVDNMGMMGTGRMSLTTDHAIVAAGQVSFLVSNTGSLTHELIVLPLDAGSPVGVRAIGSDARVDETTSLGEASANCGEGEGDGIQPDRSGWVTLTLAPGRYELICNLPRHYAAGMRALLTVD